MQGLLPSLSAGSNHCTQMHHVELHTPQLCQVHQLRHVRRNRGGHDVSEGDTWLHNHATGSATRYPLFHQLSFLEYQKDPWILWIENDQHGLVGLFFFCLWSSAINVFPAQKKHPFLAVDNGHGATTNVFSDDGREQSPHQHFCPGSREAKSAPRCGRKLKG